MMNLFCSKLPNRCKCSFKNRYRKIWDLVPITLSIFNAILIPYEISFGEISSDYWGLTVLDQVIDVIFLMDLLLMFRTTQQDRLGFEVTGNYEIYKIYSRTWRFKFDFLAMLGNSLFTSMLS